MKNKKNKTKGFTLWFTGLPCSGKSTVADKVAEKLRKKGMNVERLDGDNVREHLTKDLGFSKEDRDKNIERVTYVAQLLSRNGVAVLATFVSPYIARRNKTREEISKDAHFIEVYAKCSLEECKKRDVKGMYKKAIEGKIPNFTGISDPYEEPLNAEIIINTDKETVEESVEKMMKKLEEFGLI
ncbi:MAG: adenylyl-sulfate kinase [Candidatus Ratteibacteria bacterium]|nr:adenylyl-sulfate kinase [Candidatus Ratteibacteria bacterium]